MKKLTTLLLGGLIVAGVISCSVNQTKKAYPDSVQFSAGEFRNPVETTLAGAAQTVKIAWHYFFNKPSTAVPAVEIPVLPIDPLLLSVESSETVIYRLGHSTLLLAVKGKYWLIDPVFSDRASPVSWAGPKRFHQVPVSLALLPPLQGVLISHDHYDHLDEQSIRQLAEKTDHFVVPLGVAGYLKKWGVQADKISEQDWWQSVQIGQLNLTATPAQHFSGRGMTDRNQTLWASWVIRTPEYNLFYSGDSGYFDGFKEIGERFGPFDLTMIENGAYDELWSDVHMTPEQTLQAHQDLRGKQLMPVHNGTFDLALHAWYDPLERISSLAWDASVKLATPKIGEPLVLGQPRQNVLWWEEVTEAEYALGAN